MIWQLFYKCGFGFDSIVKKGYVNFVENIKVQNKGKIMLNKSTRSFVIIALITLLGSPALVLASTETSTVRSQNGSLVYLGDSYANLMQKMQQAPVSQRSYEWEENRKKLTAVDYIYLIDNTYYTVTVVNNVVKKIVWDRKIDH